MRHPSRSNPPTGVARALLLTAIGFPVTLLGQDVKNSADHPLFPARMPGYSISHYQQEGFSSYRFRGPTRQPIEGKYTRIHYYLKDLSQHPGGLAIRRNYENAIKSAGGEVVYSDPNASVMKVTREGVEIWAEVQASPGRIYFVYIVERTPMAQVITADAMAAAITKDGFVALDIHFATGKADLLPDSKPQLDQLVALLTKEAAWRVGIEGHTDNTGSAAGNKVLSEARARAVVAELVSRGISPGRLESVGYGQERPVGDNRQEDGRARNRRVEIVKR